jgi:hypothetical protein
MKGISMFAGVIFFSLSNNGLLSTQIENAFINNLNTKNESTTPYRCPNMLALATEPFEQPENATKTVGLIAGSTVGGVVGLVVIFCVLALVIILIQKKQRQEDDRIRRQLLTTLPTPYPGTRFTTLILSNSGLSFAVCFCSSPKPWDAGSYATRWHAWSNIPYAPHSSNRDCQCYRQCSSPS